MINDKLNEQLKQSNQKQQEKERGFISEIARVGIIYGLTKTAINKTRFKDSKVGFLAALAGTALISTSTNGSDSFAKTTGAMIAGGTALALSKKLAISNIDSVTIFLKSADAFEKNSRDYVLETFQKAKEIRKYGFDMTNIDKSISDLFSPMSKSRAYDHYENNKRIYKGLTANNNAVNNEFANYINKKIQIENKNGHSFFSQVLRNINVTDDTTKFNYDALFSKRSFFGVLKDVLATNDEKTTETYLKKFKKRIENDPTTNLENFLDFIKTEKRDSFLINEFTKSTKVNNVFKNDSTKDEAVTLSYLLNNSDDAEIITKKISKMFMMKETDIESVFGNIIIDGLAKNKKGVIYDKNVVDIKSYLLDTASAIEKTIKPSFIFLPGENLRNFSLLPFKAKTLANKRNYYNFKILGAPDDFVSEREGLNALKLKLTDPDSVLQNEMKNTLGEDKYRSNVKQLIEEIDVRLQKIDYLEDLRAKNHIQGTNGMFVPGIQKELKLGKTKIGVSSVLDENGNVVDFKIDKRKMGVSTFINDEGKLFYRSANGDWNKNKGRYDISFSETIRTNQAKAAGKYVGKKLSDFGINEDVYYDDNFFQKINNLRKKAILKVNFNNLIGFESSEKKLETFANEVNDTMDKVKELIDNKKISLFQFEKIKLASFGDYGLTNIDLFDPETFKGDLSNFESILKENFIRKLYTNDILDNFNIMKGNKFFNEAYLKETHYKSFMPAKRPTIVRKFGSYNIDSTEGKVLRIGDDFNYENNSNVNSSTFRNYLNDIFIKDKIGTEIGAYSSFLVDKFQHSLNLLGINNKGFESLGLGLRRVSARINNGSDGFKTVKKIIGESNNKKLADGLHSFGSFLENSFFIDPNKDTYNSAKHMKSIFTKRLLPFMATAVAFSALNGATDLLIPDKLYDGGITGAAAASYASFRIGLQAIAETTGLQGAANWLVSNGIDPLLSTLELDITTEEMYDRYFSGKQVAIKKNRFWFGGGRLPFSGGDTEEYRQSLLYKVQHRTSGIYKNKFERFIRQDFLPTKLITRINPLSVTGIEILDPYLEEKRAFEAGLPMARSEQLFDDIPIFGELLSTTIGNLIKPTKYYVDDKDNHYKERSIELLNAVDSSFEAFKTMSGYQGYFISSATNFLFNARNTSDFLTNQFGIDTRNYESIDESTSLTSNYYNLKLGGLFGLTEPVRRILINNKDTKNELGNYLPEWLDSAINAEYSNQMTPSNHELLMSETMLPNEKYKQLIGVSPDETGEFGLLDKMNILSNLAPSSTTFSSYKKQALKKLHDGEYTNQQAVKLFNAISMADDKLDKNDLVKDNGYVEGAELINSKIKIDEVISSNEFISNGRRFKIAGVETDFNTLSNEIGQSSAIKQIKLLNDFLSTNESLDLIYDKNNSVSVDSKGAYIDVYSPEMSSVSLQNKDTYLRTMSNLNIFDDVKEFAFQHLRNTSLPLYHMKFLSKRTANAQWYKESEQMPSFRSWETPYDSFIDPLMQLGLFNSASIQSLRGMSGFSTNLGQVYDFSSLSMPIVGSMAFSSVFGHDPLNYNKEDLTQLELENSKKANGKLSIYDLNENSSFSQIKNSLTYDESLAFNDLLNVKDDYEKQKIYNNASERFKYIIDLSDKKMDNYIIDENEISNEQENEEISYTSNSDMFVTEDSYFYNLAMAKKKAGIKLSSIDKRTLYNFRFDRMDMSSRVSNDQLRSRIYGGNSFTISSIFGNS